jgi:hypothetical protein
MRVARHIGSRLAADGHKMICPACGGDDFGPTSSLHGLRIFKEGHLPGAPMLAGACLSCGHITEPATDWGEPGGDVPDRLDEKLIRDHARVAIDRRLGYIAPQALRAVLMVDDRVIVRVNSGGNALAVEDELEARGYQVSPGGMNPDGYGCAVNVYLRSAE